MIDRKALRISVLLILAMIAATLWCLSLLPDWSHFPLNGPGDATSRQSIWLFVSPGCLLFVMAVLFARKWFATGSEDAVAPWRRWSGMMLLPYAVIIALMQAFIIARSLGIGAALDRQVLPRVFIVLIGVLIAALGNALPKLPWLSLRFRLFQLDPWQWNQHLRFMGKLIVGFGLVVALAGALLPPMLILPTLAGSWLAALAANIWYRIKLRRAPSP